MDNIVSKVNVLVPYFAFMLELICTNLYVSTKPICIIDNLDKDFMACTQPDMCTPGLRSCRNGSSRLELDWKR